MPSLRRVQDRLGTSWRLLAKELGAFGVVGVVCFFIQVGCFQLLYAHLDVGAVTSNLVATVVSMTAAYFGHRYWSFSHRERSSLGREYLLFAVINGVTLLLGIAVVAFVRYPLGQDSALVLQVANVGSIVLGTVIRYQSYRRWVFTAPADPATEPAPSTAVEATAPAGEPATERPRPAGAAPCSDGPQVEPARR